MPNENCSVEERILHAALEVVNEHTLSGTRMHLIAAQAELSQANLHYHFKTKRDLLAALLRYIQRDFSKKREECMLQQAPTLQGQLRGFFAQKKDMIQNHPELDRVQIDYWSLGQVDEKINACFQESYTIWREHVVDTIQMFCPEVDKGKAHILAGVMVSMMMGASLQYLNNHDVFDIDEYFASCEEMVMLYLEPFI